jgi:hypothetical protein
MHILSSFYSRETVSLTYGTLESFLDGTLQRSLSPALTLPLQLLDQGDGVLVQVVVTSRISFTPSKKKIKKLKKKKCVRRVQEQPIIIMFTL